MAAQMIPVTTAGLPTNEGVKAVRSGLNADLASQDSPPEETFTDVFLADDGPSEAAEFLQVEQPAEDPELTADPKPDDVVTDELIEADAQFTSVPIEDDSEIDLWPKGAQERPSGPDLVQAKAKEPAFLGETEGVEQIVPREAPSEKPKIDDRGVAGLQRSDATRWVQPDRATELGPQNKAPDLVPMGSAQAVASLVKEAAKNAKPDVEKPIVPGTDMVRLRDRLQGISEAKELGDTQAPVKTSEPIKTSIAELSLYARNLKTGEKPLTDASQMAPREAARTEERLSSEQNAPQKSIKANPAVPNTAALPITAQMTPQKIQAETRTKSLASVESLGDRLAVLEGSDKLLLTPTTASGRSEASFTTSTPVSTPAANQVARSAIVQIVQSNAKASNGSVTVKLFPEELGTVTYRLAANETGATIVVTVERPETLDLLKRHSNDLLNEFQNFGVGAQDLSFEQQARGEDDTRDGRSAEFSNEPATDQSGLAPSLDRSSVVLSGVDIRL